MSELWYDSNFKTAEGEFELDAIMYNYGEDLQVLRERIAELEKVGDAAVHYFDHLPLHMHDEWAVSVIKALREAGYLKEDV